MRYRVFTKMMPVFFLSAALAQAQSPTPSQKEQLQQVQQRLQDLEALRQQLLRQRGAVPGGAATAYGAAAYNALISPAGAWWTNANLVVQLGLTDEQKANIQKIFDNHKQHIESDSNVLSLNEAQLGSLLAADRVDHNAVMGQIDRVAQARADLERSNSAMTLEMREVLTAAQWTKLQSQPSWIDGNIGGIRTFRYFSRWGASTPPQPSGQRGQRQQ